MLKVDFIDMRVPVKSLTFGTVVFIPLQIKDGVLPDLNECTPAHVVGFTTWNKKFALETRNMYGMHEVFTPDKLMFGGE